VCRTPQEAFVVLLRPCYAILASSMALTHSQISLITAPVGRRIFLSGPAGSGKTTVGVERLLHLMAQGVRADSILVIVPQRTLATPYYEALSTPGVVAGGVVSILTVGGLAQRMVELFWPLAAETAGFAHPDEPPSFLTLETAQYYMARLVRPLLDQRYFESIAISRNRLYSQIVDNLNKAAVVGFPYTEIGARLKAAWVGESSQARVYDDAQDCANRFRQYCLENNLLDFSLQIEVFRQYLWTNPLCRQYLARTYCHLIMDNVEEDTPVAHDLVAEWLPEFDSALLIYDTEAGYRRFLGTDPQSGYRLREQCDEQISFNELFVSSPELMDFAGQLSRGLNRPPIGENTLFPGTLEQAPLSPIPFPLEGEGEEIRNDGILGNFVAQNTIISGSSKSRGMSGGARSAILFEYHRYFPQMLDWVAEQIARLVFEEQTPPGAIVVLAPFLPDALRFSLIERLERQGIPSRSHRPSRALREEPAAQCLLTLAMLAHPQWGLCPTKFDVAYALIQAIEGMDLVRAQLLAEIVYRVHSGQPTLSSFERIRPETQARITFVLGRRYEALSAWLEAYSRKPEEEIDYFFSRLFGEVLSQPGFGFHQNYTTGEVAANLVESARKFRWAVGTPLSPTPYPLQGEGENIGNLDALGSGAAQSIQISSIFPSPLGRGGASKASFRVREKTLGQEYLEMVQDGVVAAQYIHGWQIGPEDAVLLAPAYTFLMNNRPVDYQFWLDIGSRGWFERLEQPLTHPYVLSRQWPQNTPWTDVEEYETSQETLYRLTLGLLRRCRQKVFLGLCELNEQGNDQKGPLLKAIQRVLRSGPPGPFTEEDLDDARA
jgi:hypothetical protein